MKKYFLLGGICIVVVIIAFVVFSKNSQKPSMVTPPTPTPKSEQVGFRGLLVGASSKQEVIARLGNPVRQEQIQHFSTLIYPSSVGTSAIHVRLDQKDPNKTLLAIEPVDPTEKFTEKGISLGTPDFILYGPFYRMGYFLHVYLQKGVALLANPKTNIIKERWYFQPTNRTFFTKIIAPDFESTPPPEELP